MNEFFRRFSQRSSQLLGSSWAFLAAGATIVVWAASGPLFRYSDTWQLAINTGTTIVTFLMVFLIQNSQNRDTRAIHIKLDEIIRVQTEARNSLLNLEDMTDEDLDRLQEEFKKLHDREIRRKGGIPSPTDPLPAPQPPPGSIQGSAQNGAAAIPVPIPDGWTGSADPLAPTPPDTPARSNDARISPTGPMPPM